MIGKMNKNKILTILFLVVVSFLILINFNDVFYNKQENSTVILEKISKMKELTTTKYYYSNIISFKEDKKIQNIKIPFTQKSFLIKYEGVVKAGIDINDVEILENKEKKIRIKLNNSKILEHNINEKNIYVYDEKTSLFNKLSMKDVFNEITKEKKNIEKKLVEDGFLEEADKNTKLLLESILRDLGYEKIEIVFEKYK
ncbi:DUF4230 domain-containing protein [Tepidibacter thalassicus]|uniref:DUF4230 domain-containing protein n=1 Tax=Tepidibacter thalassicus DSM 15285 TaxID=1123350 RepID=A0A1M5TS84_9FIRM|nr:DUF4230 domain-containing protein [Tepidibacter thalassicus]SHH53541.1 Protein of unknown function [Tepidibacter thalassicus DSM 15285]